MGDGRVVLILDVAALFEGRRHALVRPRTDAASPRVLSVARSYPKAASGTREEPRAPPRMPRRGAGRGLDHARGVGCRRPAAACPSRPRAWPRTSWPWPRPRPGPSAAPREPDAPAPAPLAPAPAPRAHNISFFAAPTREERKAVEATEHLATFFLAGEEYGVDVRLVQEIIRVSEITQVPRAPEFVKGVINLRGRIIPVVDLKRKLGLGEVDGPRGSRASWWSRSASG